MTSPDRLEILTPEITGKIKALPSFTGDVSKLVNKTPEEIATIARETEGGLSLNISNAADFEIENIEKANTILGENEEELITLFNEKEQIGEITSEISRKIIDEARNKFREFIFKAIETPSEDEGGLHNFVVEFRDFIATREGETFETSHYWENIGLSDLGNPLRDDVKKLLAEIRQDLEQEPDFRRNIMEEILKLGDLNKSEIKNEDEIIDSLLLGMFSNMVRGVFYKEANADKVYGMRKLAVDVLEGSGEGEDGEPEGDKLEKERSDRKDASEEKKRGWINKFLDTILWR